jgi:hypothetical protein
VPSADHSFVAPSFNADGAMVVVPNYDLCPAVSIEQIAATLMGPINALGVDVVIEAQHLCMMMRGVQKQNSMMVTSCMLGAFRTRSETRMEFLSFIKHQP